MAKKSTEVKETIGIVLQVPKDLYFDIKTKADKDTYEKGEKKTIHDKMIEQLRKANKK